MGTFPGIPLAGAGLFREGKGSPMSANDRIIRDEADEDGIFDAPTAHAPRIDLILGVSLAIVASVVAVLGSLGVGSINARPDLTSQQRAVASTPAAQEDAPIVVKAPEFEGPLFTENAFADDRYAFELVDAPDTPEAPRPIVIDRVNALEDAEVIIECVGEADAPEDEGVTDRQRVVRMVAAAARMVADDAEAEAAIDELRVTVESLVDRAERLDAAPTVERTGPTALRVPRLRLPRFDRGL